MSVTSDDMTILLTFESYIEVTQIVIDLSDFRLIHQPTTSLGIINVWRLTYL